MGEAPCKDIPTDSLQSACSTGVQVQDTPAEQARRLRSLQSVRMILNLLLQLLIFYSKCFYL